MCSFFHSARREQEFAIGWEATPMLNDYQLRKTKNKEVTGKITTNSIISGQLQPRSKDNSLPATYDPPQSYGQPPSRHNYEPKPLSRHNYEQQPPSRQTYEPKSPIQLQQQDCTVSFIQINAFSTKTPTSPRKNWRNSCSSTRRIAECLHAAPSRKASPPRNAELPSDPGRA